MARDERSAIERHLAACGACHAEALRERAVHDLLRSRAGALRETAPAHLRDRVRRGSRVLPLPSTRPARRAATSWRMPLAAGLLLALIGAGAFAPAGSVLAAQLAFDHLKCQWLSPSNPGVDPETLETHWQDSHGWAIDVPPGDPAAGLVLEGARRCLFHGGSMAHVFYRFEGQSVSLFIVPSPSSRDHGQAIMGIDTLTWAAGDRTYALVGGVPHEQLVRAARALRQR
jgi:anti-sigma factor RsiW